MGCGDKTKISKTCFCSSQHFWAFLYMNVFDVILTRTIVEYLIVKVAKIKNF